MYRVFQLLFAVLLFNSIECDDGYVYNAEVRMSYRYFSVPVPWFDAKIICHDDGSELAMPKNEAEAGAILNVILQNPPPPGSETAATYNFVALDSHDLFAVNEFVTQDFNIQYFNHNWDINQPDDTNNERCIFMNRNGKMHNHFCTLNFVFICQKQDQSYVKALQNNRAIPDDPTYILEPNTGKYFKLHMYMRTWAAARAVCHAEGGRLAIIGSRVEELFLANMFSEPKNLWPTSTLQYAFLGFHDYYRINRYFTVYDEDLAVLPYVQWAAGEPNHLTPDERCGSMDKQGRLKDSPCSVPAQFFCERK